MSIEDLQRVFTYLENKMNPQNLLYFKLTDKNEITAYFKESSKKFATFYIYEISKFLKRQRKEEQ
ncbi:MAG TPA: hypothetical protein IAD49_03105 [Candidatus Fimihabitans intestinipullorum]|uniref:Uncharacterized protein n=1 Tax=Candidatus Fimihabitans intestinipullorum TaxID=2840820 RepID=A0A9D1L402_9BACT|nr:hypothetical protein [Candidatus Fimihabitans intestinipullorum]